MTLPRCSVTDLKLVDPCVAGETVGTEEQTAVTITGVPQAAFAEHNVQYQFRTENSGGQVSRRLFLNVFHTSQLVVTGGVAKQNGRENLSLQYCAFR